MLIKFITLNIESPEFDRISNLPVQQRSDIDLKYKTVVAEIDDHLDCLNRNKGNALMATKDKAKSKLIKKEDMTELSNRIKKKVCNFIDDDKNNKLDTYTHQQTLNIRDTMLACGAKSIPRRSLELMCMTLDEVKMAEKRIINGEECIVIEVADQKTRNTGEKAAVIYDPIDFEALQIYISKIRPKILDGRKSTEVFPTSKTMLNRSSENTKLSFSNTNRIMSNFRTKQGKKLSTRVIRQSCITHSRKSNSTYEQRIALAKAMNHTYNTAQKHYDFSGVAGKFHLEVIMQFYMYRYN